MEPIYPMLYNILEEFIFGSGAELTPHMVFVLTEMATFGCIAACAVPFAFVWIIIKSFFKVVL